MKILYSDILECPKTELQPSENLVVVTLEGEEIFEYFLTIKLSVLDEILWMTIESRDEVLKYIIKGLDKQRIDILDAVEKYPSILENIKDLYRDKKIDNLDVGDI